MAKKKLKKFLAVYIGSENSPAAKKWDKMDKATAAKQEALGMNGWMNWVKKHDKALLDMGAPLGSTLKVDSKGVKKAVNQITAYTVIEAVSHKAAAKMFLKHPHFAIFPGDCVEIMDCLPIPGME